MSILKVGVVALVLWLSAAATVWGAETTVAAGTAHSCTIEEPTGTVWCWGDNTYGQLGTTPIGGSQPTRAQVPGLGGVVAVSAGDDHTCALISIGDVWCWGRNSNRQLGSTTTGNQPSAAPLKVAGLQLPVTAISAGGAHTCALRNNGTVMCWGRNNVGQLGRTTISGPQVTPAVAIGVTQAVSLSAGDSHTCVVTSGGLALCWGINDFGQLGRGTQGDPQPTASMVGNLSNAITISAGGSHTCAVKNDGTAMCWGLNDNGQVGMGVSGGSQLTPQPVLQLTEVSDISAGQHHTCVYRGNESALCWGKNHSGQLGNGTTLSSATPQAVVGMSGAVAIAAGEDHTCARRGSGSVVCWGGNSIGQLGIGTAAGNLAVPQPTGLGNVDIVSAGFEHTCALRDDGTVACWGRNAQGQLGSAGGGFKPTPQMVANLSGVTALAAGAFFNCALKQGTVWCWGDNGYGQLGTDSGGEPRSTPLQIADMTNVVALSLGAFHACALKQDGSTWCWGNNGYGQLGTAGSPSTVVAVAGLGSAKALAAGSYHTCALKQEGAVWCWGDNTYGQLGIGSLDVDPHPIPQPVTGLSGAIGSQLMAGFAHTCARVTLVNGQIELKCWGVDNDGQLGTGGGTQPQPTPQFLTLNSSLRGVGGAATCARNDSLGTLYCCGGNASGQLATGAYNNHDVLTSSPGFADVVSIAIGGSHACGLSATGMVTCAGNAFYGQRGDGVAGHSPTPLPVIGFEENIIFADGFDETMPTREGRSRPL